MAATRRLQKELGEIRNSSSKSFRDVQVDESNLLVWQGLLVPEKAPYNKVWITLIPRIQEDLTQDYLQLLHAILETLYIIIPFVPGCVHN